jgi:hypothetical protein
MHGHPNGNELYPSHLQGVMDGRFRMDRDALPSKFYGPLHARPYNNLKGAHCFYRL